MANTNTTGSRRTPLDRAGLTVLAMLVLITGGLVSTFGPLLAIACDTCEDGVRTPEFANALMLVARFGVPLTTLVTVAAIFLPRGGAKAGGIGLGVLTVLMVTLLALGQ
jgi:hypothetical protein